MSSNGGSKQGVIVAAEAVACDAHALSLGAVGELLESSLDRDASLVRRPMYIFLALFQSATSCAISSSLPQSRLRGGKRISQCLIEYEGSAKAGFQ